MRDTDEKVMRRYSFVDTFEDGMLIRCTSHFHSIMTSEGSAVLSTRIPSLVGDLNMDFFPVLKQSTSLAVKLCVVVLGALAVNNEVDADKEESSSQGLV
jgi:hypothetical protein